MSETSKKPVLKKSELVFLIKEKGYSRKELAEHYKVSVGEINHYIKTFNIKIKAKKVSYELIDDTEPQTPYRAPWEPKNTENNNVEPKESELRS